DPSTSRATTTASWVAPRRRSSRQSRRRRGTAAGRPCGPSSQPGDAPDRRTESWRQHTPERPPPSYYSAMRPSPVGPAALRQGAPRTAPPTSTALYVDFNRVDSTEAGVGWHARLTFTPRDGLADPIVLDVTLTTRPGCVEPFAMRTVPCQ